jgi:uncharacterized RDD family membrane protein YckC
MYCSSCGRLTTAGARFCDGCGTATNNTPAHVPVYGAQPYAPSYATTTPSGMQTGAGYREFADYGRRIGAYLVDWVVQVIGSIALILGLALALAVAMPNSENAAIIVLMAGYLGAFLGYQWWASASGRSLGKRALGIRVIAMDTGRAPGAGRGFVRMIVTLLIGLASMILLPFSLIDHLWPLWDERRQTLHDKAAGTLVVRDASDAMPVHTGHPTTPSGHPAPAYAPARHGGWSQPQR